MPLIQIVAVGRLREPHWKSAAQAYARRLQHGYDLVETTVKDGDSALAPAERSRVEGERILQCLRGNVCPISLDERGEALASPAFAALLRRCFEAATPPAFIIGGAYGLSDAVRQRAMKSISFGPMTFPHELARVLLLEQLYRADAIIHGRPYHHV